MLQVRPLGGIRILAGVRTAEGDRKGHAQMTHVIAEPCVNVKDKSCVAVCPVDCIYEGETMLYIHPDECIDCGLCIPECPVDAIFTEDELPEQWRNYTQINADFFKK